MFSFSGEVFGKRQNLRKAPILMTVTPCNSRMAPYTVLKHRGTRCTPQTNAYRFDTNLGKENEPSFG